MRLPMALELLELLATFNIPQADRVVRRPTDELRWICRVEMDAKDLTAAIVSNVSFIDRGTVCFRAQTSMISKDTGNCSTPLPR